MPVVAHREQADPADGFVVVRSLRREYRIHTRNRDLANTLGFLRADPEMPGVELKPVPIEIDEAHGFFRLERPGGPPFEGSADSTLAYLHRLIARSVSDEAPGSPLIHGATFARPEGRVVFIGDKGSGKTTLSLHLLLRGHTMEGDEHIAVLSDGCLTRPRNMRIKEGSLHFFPALAEVAARSPSLPHPDGGRIYSVSPAIAAGRAWRIEPSRITDIVFIDANHGGSSVMGPSDANDAFRRLMRNVVLPDAEAGSAVARLRALVVRARRWRLSLGSLETASFHIDRLLA